MPEPDYIVIRPAPDLPPRSLSPRFDGLWLDRSDMTPPSNPEAGRDTAARYNGMVAVPTGRFEIRDYDGAIAEVYEVRP